MKIETLKTKLEHHLGIIEELIKKELKNDGDTSSTSQKVCVQIAINELYYTFNGITKADMAKNPN